MGSSICGGRNRYEKFVGQIRLGFSRNFAYWATQKDLELETALSRNKRWIVNNQIKNIILRCPDQVASVKWIQTKFRSLDRRGKALNWLKKYPGCYEVFWNNDEYYCRLTKTIMDLVEEEAAMKEMQEPVFAERLAKLLMMSFNHRLKAPKIHHLQRSFGLPDDYILKIVPKYPDMFRVVNDKDKPGSMEIVLESWQPDLAVSAIEKVAQREGRNPCFSCKLPTSWVKARERFEEFNSTPYISPYTSPRGLWEGSKELETRTVAIMHELLSLTLWRKVSIFKLERFRKEFYLPDKLNVVLLRHPGIFYVSNKYNIYTVLLREAYNGSELIDKDPLVIVKDKFGPLMQEGPRQYRRRCRLFNLEKKRKKLEVVLRPEEKMNQTGDANLGGILDPEERRRFYKVLFEDDGS